MGSGRNNITINMNNNTNHRNHIFSFQAYRNPHFSASTSLRGTARYDDKRVFDDGCFQVEVFRRFFEQRTQRNVSRTKRVVIRTQMNLQVSARLPTRITTLEIDQQLSTQAGFVYSSRTTYSSCCFLITSTSTLQCLDKTTYFLHLNYSLKQLSFWTTSNFTQVSYAKLLTFYNLHHFCITFISKTVTASW